LEGVSKICAEHDKTYAPNIIQQTTNGACGSGPFCHAKPIAYADDRDTRFGYGTSYEKPGLIQEGTKMDTVRREERTAVVNDNVASDGTVYSGPRVADVNSNGPARTTAHQTETFTGDP
jgi:hypothetical protein